MRYSNLEALDIMINHIQNLRRSLPGEPSPETLAAWRLEDERRQMLRDYYAQQEAATDDDNDFTFDFTSEVKRK